MIEGKLVATDSRARGSWHRQQNDRPQGGRGAKYHAAVSAQPIAPGVQVKLAARRLTDAARAATEALYEGAASGNARFDRDERAAMRPLPVRALPPRE